MGKTEELNAMVAGFDHYQREAAKTDSYSEIVDVLDFGVEAPELRRMLKIFYPAVGLGEAGEAQNKIKKILRDAKGHLDDERRMGIMKELGGLLWYVAETARQCEISMGAIALNNIAELRSRQERGTLRGDGDNR